MLKGLCVLSSDSQALPSTFATCCQYNVRWSCAVLTKLTSIQDILLKAFASKLSAVGGILHPLPLWLVRISPLVWSGPKDQLLKMQKTSIWSSFHFLCKTLLCTSSNNSMIKQTTRWTKGVYYPYLWSLDLATHTTVQQCLLSMESWAFSK